jgi:pimeloyl-ACP methyl ester carboxylesterase
MKLLVIISCLVLAATLMVAVLLLSPMPKNFAHYLWWRTMSAATALTGAIRSGDAIIHFRSSGQGQPVLLLHGGLSHRLSWFSQEPWLVDSGRQVILPDTRGHGESGLGDAELSYRLLATDAIHVLDQLGIQCADVIGWSDGANTALLMAQFWPERVGRIVAISGNSDPSGLTPQAYVDNHVQDSGLIYWVKRWWTGAGGRFTELENRIKKLWRTEPNLQAVDLRAIEAPTLVIIGENDQVTLGHARQMVSLLPHGSLSVIQGGGHATLMTHADQVNALIGHFLGLSSLPGDKPG